MEESIEMDQEPTTLWVKRGTKRMLDELGARRETYDDIIRRLVRQSQHEEGGIEAENRLVIGNERTQKSSALLDDCRIDYLYTVPQKPPRPDFRFRISYLKVIRKGREYGPGENYRKEGSKAMKASIELLAKDYLRIVEQVIRTAVDHLFRVDEKRILDLDWWKRKCAAMGLPDIVFEEDIKLELIKRGVHP